MRFRPDVPLGLVLSRLAQGDGYTDLTTFFLTLRLTNGFTLHGFPLGLRWAVGAKRDKPTKRWAYCVDVRKNGGPIAASCSSAKHLIERKKRFRSLRRIICESVQKATAQFAFFPEEAS